MNFSSVKKDIGSLLSSGFFRVPRFQRPYAWTREELEDFWTDAIDEGEDGYFIGSVVVFKDNDAGSFGIVDGQQRLTTITMILCAIRDAFESYGHKALADGLHDTMIERRNLESLDQFVLQPDSTHKYFEEHVQKREAPDTAATPGPEQAALNSAYKYLREQIDSYINAQVAGNTTPRVRKSSAKKHLSILRDRLRSLSFILVELDDEDSAYLLFEVLNARGKDLDVSDLVKNHLTKLKRQTNTALDTVKSRWNELNATIQSAGAIVKLDNFIHHHWLSKYDYVSEQNLFKAIRGKIIATTANRYLNELRVESHLYRTIFEPELTTWRANQLAIRNSLIGLRTFKVRQPTPLVLSLLSCLNAGTLTPRQVADALNAIEVFHFQFTAVASQSSSGGISKMYALHAREVRSRQGRNDKVRSIRDFKRKLRERLPTPDEFDAKFTEMRFSTEYTRDRNLVRYALGRIARKKLGTDALDVEHLTIEHIEPQGETQIPVAAASIGNLILVDDDLNTDLDNKAFKTKKSKLRDAGHVWVDTVLDTATEWGEDQIAERAQTLAQLARSEIWRI